MLQSLQGLVVSGDHWNRTAVCYDDGDIKVYVTYSDLLQSSSELTSNLRKCVGVKKLIALYTPPSVDMFVAIIGILNVPAAYVPIALNQPNNDKVNLLQHLWISTVVVHSRVMQEFLTLPWHNTAKLHCESSRGGLYIYSLIPHSGEPLLREKMENSVPQDLAYIMTTSGTTGLPKIVRVPHCCIVPNIVDLRKHIMAAGKMILTLRHFLWTVPGDERLQRFKLTSDDLVFNAAPYTFDPSVVEMFLAFSSGAALLVVPAAIKVSPTQLANVVCHRNCPTIIQATPSLICSLGSDVIKCTLLGPQSSLRVLAFGGEACPSLTTVAQWQHAKNSTRIFNIYGITEVSSWATCYELPHASDLRREQSNDPVDDSINALNSTSTIIVPLGDPLLDTCIELHDEQGCVISCGDGEIWIGGCSRVCLLDDEEQCVAGTMRPTGDHGSYMSDGQLCYIGRRDKQMKRLGHRINLDYIQQVICDLSLVKTCAIVSYASDGHNLLWGDNYTTLLLFVVLNSYDESNCDVLLNELHSKMRQLLPTYSIPDSVILMDALPMTHHGKVDSSLLLNKYTDGSVHNRHLKDDSFTSIDSVELWIATLAKTVGVDSWKSDSTLTQCGGDSFQLIRIINMLDSKLGTKVSNALGDFMEMALNKSLHDAAVFLFKHLTCHLTTTEETNFDDDIVTMAVPVAKKQKLSHMITTGTQLLQLRKGHFYVNSKVMFPRLHHTLQVTSSLSLTMEALWKVDTQKCVDASPLIASWDNGDEASWVTFIGSHSGLFFAIDVLSGDILWQVLLTDRIMSSAVLSACGKYVIVGCYDGYIYVLDALTGNIHWALSVGSEPIKSSPSVDKATSLVWFGSHDRHLYSVDIENKEISDKLSINGGIITSSPLIDVQLRQLYITTLAGHVIAINCDNKEVVWRYKFPKPAFSSASLLHDHSIIAGCVNGELVKFTPDGTVAGRLCSKEAIFESTCPYTLSTADNISDSGVNTLNVKQWNEIIELSTTTYTNDTHSQNLFLFGDHDCNLHSVTEEMCLNWKIKLDSALGACPFIGNLILPRGKLAICCCSTTNGNVFILDVTTGGILATTKLPSEVFSSPLIVGDRVIMGCRDNNVYCLKINTK